MQIEDNILLKVEETDIDENGKCIIPNGVKQIAENAINSDKIHFWVIIWNYEKTYMCISDVSAVFKSERMSA